METTKKQECTRGLPRSRPQPTFLFNAAFFVPLCLCVSVFSLQSINGIEFIDQDTMPLRPMYEETDADNQDSPLRPGTDTEIPFITHPELSPNRLDERGASRPKPITLIAYTGEHGRQLRSTVVANLPQGVSGDSCFRHFSKQFSPGSSLDLDCIATRNVYSTLPCTQLIAC